MAPVVYFSSRRKEFTPFTKAELDQLAQALTKPRTDYLTSLSLAEQRDQVQDWLRSVSWRPFARPELSEDQVKKMLDELPQDVRTKMLSRSRYEIERFLRDRDFGPGMVPPPGMGRDGPRGRGGPDFDFRGRPPSGDGREDRRRD
jgi:hypothetical protein